MTFLSPVYLIRIFDIIYLSYDSENHDILKIKVKFYRICNIFVIMQLA